jgi:hypothetical protein
MHQRFIYIYLPTYLSLLLTYFIQRSFQTGNKYIFLFEKIIFIFLCRFELRNLLSITVKAFFSFFISEILKLSEYITGNVFQRLS